MDRASTGGQMAPANRRFTRRVAMVALGLASLLAMPPVAAGTPFLPAAAPIAETDRATPALWEVRDGDTTIYLFGTFHSLDERTAWFDRSVRAAFDRSNELVLETIAPSDPRDIAAIGRRVIGPRPAAASFLGQTRVAIDEGRRAGLSVDRGVDAVLRRAAVDQGKRIAGIEDFADQLRTFARISSIPTAPAPAPTPASSPTVRPVTLAALLAAWKAGDTHAFTAMLDLFEAKAPTAYRLLIADRNALYGQWIARRLRQPGTVFVAVGSGHLAGKDSVQKWLAANGVRALRIA